MCKRCRDAGDHVPDVLGWRHVPDLLPAGFPRTALRRFEVECISFQNCNQLCCSYTYYALYSCIVRIVLELENGVHHVFTRSIQDGLEGWLATSSSWLGCATTMTRAVACWYLTKRTRLRTWMQDLVVHLWWKSSRINVRIVQCFIRQPREPLKSLICNTWFAWDFGITKFLPLSKSTKSTRKWNRSSRVLLLLRKWWRKVESLQWSLWLCSCDCLAHCLVVPWLFLARNSSLSQQNWRLARWNSNLEDLKEFDFQVELQYKKLDVKASQYFNIFEIHTIRSRWMSESKFTRMNCHVSWIVPRVRHSWFQGRRLKLRSLWHVALSLSRQILVKVWSTLIFHSFSLLTGMMLRWTFGQTCVSTSSCSRTWICWTTGFALRPNFGQRSSATQSHPLHTLCPPGPLLTWLESSLSHWPVAINPVGGCWEKIPSNSINWLILRFLQRLVGCSQSVKGCWTGERCRNQSWWGSSAVLVDHKWGSHCKASLHSFQAQLTQPCYDIAMRDECITVDAWCIAKSYDGWW